MTETEIEIEIVSLKVSDEHHAVIVNAYDYEDIVHNLLHHPLSCLEPYPYPFRYHLSDSAVAAVV